MNSYDRLDAFGIFPSTLESSSDDLGFNPLVVYQTSSIRGSRMAGTFIY